VGREGRMWNIHLADGQVHADQPVHPEEGRGSLPLAWP